MVSLLATRLICAIGTVLVIAFAFSSPAVSNVLAAPMHPGFASSKNCTHSAPTAISSSTCCWREKIPGSILGEKYCQTCYYGPNGLLTSCDDKELQYVKTPSEDQSNTLPPTQGGGNVLQEPSTDSKLPNLFQKGGALEKLQGSNTTISEDN